MFCPQCGAENKNEAKFCSSCGAPIEARHQAAAAAAAANAANAQPNTPTGAPTAAPAPAKKERAYDVVGAALGAVLLIGFFLPVIGASGFGISVSISASGLAFGNDYGLTEPLAFFLIVPGIVALALAFLLKPIFARGAAFAGVGAVSLIALIALQNYINSQTMGIVNMQLGYYVLLLASVALLAWGVKLIMDAKKIRTAA